LVFELLLLICTYVDISLPNIVAVYLNQIVVYLLFTHSN